MMLIGSVDGQVGTSSSKQLTKTSDQSKGGLGVHCRAISYAFFTIKLGELPLVLTLGRRGICQAWRRLQLPPSARPWEQPFRRQE